VNQGAVPSVEMAIEQALYWPDGRRKKRSKSLVSEQTGNKVRRLVQALVDKHNDDRKLFRVHSLSLSCYHDCPMSLFFNPRKNS
jgi:hypothetical protein